MLNSLPKVTLLAIGSAGIWTQAPGTVPAGICVETPGTLLPLTPAPSLPLYFLMWPEQMLNKYLLNS